MGKKVYCWVRLPLLIVTLVCPAASMLFGEVTTIWAVNDGEKVYRYQSDHPGREGNSVWDGRIIQLKGLYNEVLAFQVIVETDEKGAGGLEVHAEPLIHGESGARIGGLTPNGIGSEGGLEVFSEHYIKVDRPTNPAWFYGSEVSAPPRGTGWIPDPLIPTHAVAGRGGFPVSVPLSKKRLVRSDHEMQMAPAETTQNQGFWIDLYLPRSRSVPSGLYRGSVRVLEAGKSIVALPLEVTLLPHFLPDENHSNVWLYTSRIEHYFPGTPADRLERMLKHLGHRHRIDLVGGFSAHRSRFDPVLMEAYKPYLDGRAFTQQHGYQGPGQGVGEKLFAVGMYGSPVLGDTRESIQRESDRWVTWFEKHAPDVTYFWYMVDEPGSSYYPWFKERAHWIKSNPGPGARLPIFVTRGYTPELEASVDIWAGHNGVDLERLPEIHRQGKDYWFYNGHRPRYGAVLLEAEAVDFRVNAWVKYRHRVGTWFLWHGTHWTHNHQGPKGQLHQRVFSEPATFVNWGGTHANGDGIVFYPGRMPFYPEEDRGLNEVLGSIRLKNIRRGQQDYEILWLAEQRVGRDRVLEIVREIVPQSLEADLKGPVHWSQRGDDYDRAREKLLALLDE